MQRSKIYVQHMVRFAMLAASVVTVWSCGQVKAAESETEAATVELTAEEQAFVDSGQEIVIGCPTDTCPLLFQNPESDALEGITIDVLNMVSEATGLHFKYEALPTGDVTYQDLQKAQMDMVASVEYHDLNEQARGIVMTDPYLHTSKVFVCKKGVVLDPSKNMVIAAASGSQTLSKVLQGIYPNFRVDYYTTTEDALSALLGGEADAVLQNQYSLQRILAKPIYDDLQIVDEAAIGDFHCLAALVPMDEDKHNIIDRDTELLLSILNKGIRSLDENEVSFCIIKESAENVYQYTVEDFIYRYRYAIIIIVISFALILFLLWQVYVLWKKREQQFAAEQRAKELAMMNEQMSEQQVLMKDALARAEAASRAKTSFLFNMSHDIRTPMNAILGLTAIALNHRDDPEKVIESVEKIDEFGKRLMQLLGNVLDMTMIENGEVDLSEDICDICDTVEHSGDILKTDIGEKNLTLNVDVSDIRNRKVYCDEIRLNQIMFNLLSNAVKFSKQDGVIDVRLRQKDTALPEVFSYELRVKDNGIGMTKEFQEHIFEEFERERPTTVSGAYGTGLGMSITKSLVDLMGGTIEVFSEPDKGAEFIINFILKIGDEESEELTAAKEEEPEEEAGVWDDVDFTGRRILVAEDNEVNAEIITEILGAVGLAIETAENGQLAVEKLQNSKPGYYDLILMDVQMPVMNGYETAKKIRDLENKELANIPIIAMTANTFEEDVKEALASGMNDHLSKPVDVDKLVKTLRKFFGV